MNLTNLTYSPFPTRTSFGYSGTEAVRLNSSRTADPNGFGGNIRNRTRPVNTPRAYRHCEQLHLIDKRGYFTNLRQR